MFHRHRTPSLRSPFRISILVGIALAVGLSALPATGQLALSIPQAGEPSANVFDADRAAADSRRVVAGVATPSCAGGLVYDDDEADNGIRLILDDGAGSGASADVVMRFDAGAANRRIEQVCVCWNRVQTPPATFLHELVFFEDAGSGPGSLIAVVPVSIQSPPPLLDTTFFSYDVSSFDVRTVTENVYVGVSFFGGDDGEPGHVLCVDQDGPGQQPMFASFAGQGNWVSSEDLAAGAEISPPTAWMIRADLESPQPETCPQTPCVEDATTLCLNDDRFRVTAEWATTQGTSGPGMAPDDELTADTNYFWFFKETNVELVVKVLNGCGVNGHYWVFAGGLTNVEVELKVCDTQEGMQRTYFNPQETPFQPIQDNAAFATCP